MAIKTATELAEKCKEVAKKYKTLYVLGCFGAPMNDKNKERYSENNKRNVVALENALKENRHKAARQRNFQRYRDHQKFPEVIGRYPKREEVERACQIV